MTTRSAIRQTTVVRSSQDHAFEVFVRRMGEWWPTNPFSLGQASVVDVVVSPEVGGDVVEVRDDGSTATWGRVLVWEPPTRFAMSWEVFAGGTEVELTFASLGPNLTQVELEHRGWERLDAEQIREVTQSPGGYEGGWAEILETFRRGVDEAAELLQDASRS